MSRFIEPNLNPPDYDDGVTELQEEVGQLLEDANMPTATVDAIMKLIAEAERAKAAEADAGFAGDEASP